MHELIPLCEATNPAMDVLHIVLCPFAGASMGAFRHWREVRIEGIQLWLAVYPGRDHRMKEPCLASIDALADQVLAGIAARQIGAGKLVVAGHSMGAQVAYEVCARMERTERFPRGLVLSGCHAPHLHGRRPIAHLDDISFRRQLVAIGGCAPELLQEHALWPVFMPMLRADFRATESYWRPAPAAAQDRLKTAALLVYGSADQEASQDEVDAWQVWLDDVPAAVPIAGDHFYATRRPRAFLEHIRSRFELNDVHGE